MLIDLHTHSDRSDGTDTPVQLLAGAVAAGLDVLGVTDHDTTGGWEAVTAARPAGLTVVLGTEFSTQVALAGRQVSVHLLGYLFDPTDPTIVAEHLRLRQARLLRGMAIVQRLVAAGVPISEQQVLEIAAGAPVGRPHIGRALVAAGVVDSVTDAFATYLSGQGPYYVPKPDTDLPAAVSMIAAAGGVPVLAHPRGRGEGRVLTPDYIGTLVDLGLAGVEVDHPDHGPEVRGELRELAGRLGLVMTGSSDYHGSNKTLRLGQEHTAPEQLAALIDRSSGVVRPLGPLARAGGGE
ncbi:PHP domain-containing protein [Nakamurella flavida]|uniref:PHP domain-containing protein n=1 Tax=Nakamurella flavida TaxID=363630 RepID=A0A938YH56_9ACTN|nr:PHP domain-containing protein [Nakamurella flavida]MBM9474984.1 PHP domain-containing protein [Nakamurella flavida]MDP9776553.1 putative metal-dependent phosphoesterase TrpH [Nakamurella flavida]